MKIVLKHYKCPSWNILYSGRHWSTRADMADYAHISIVEICGDIKQFKKPVDIIVTAYLVRMIDCDNVCSKLVIDGLKNCFIIKDDSPKYVKSVTTKVVKSKKDYTVIEII